MGFYKTGLLPGGAWGHTEGEGGLNLGLRQEEDSSKEEAGPAPPSGPRPSLWAPPLPQGPPAHPRAPRTPESISSSGPGTEVMHSGSSSDSIT